METACPIPSYVLPGHSGCVNWCAASSTGLIATVGFDSLCLVWKMDESKPSETQTTTQPQPQPQGRVSFRLLHEIWTHQSRVVSCIFSPDGAFLATCGSDARVYVICMKQGLILHVLTHDQASVVYQAAFSPLYPLKPIILTTGSDSVARLWDVRTGDRLAALRHHRGEIRHIGFSPDGSRAVLCSYDQSASIIALPDASLVHLLKGHKDIVRYADFASDGRLLATASYDNTLRLWKVSDGDCIGVLSGHTDWVYVCRFVPSDPNLLVSGSGDNTLRVWNVRNKACVHVLAAHSALVWSLAFIPDSLYCVSASMDSTARIWDVSTGECVQVLEGHRASVMHVCNLQGHSGGLLTSSADMEARIWFVSKESRNEPCKDIFLPDEFYEESFTSVRLMKYSALVAATNRNLFPVDLLKKKPLSIRHAYLQELIANNTKIVEKMTAHVASLREVTSRLTPNSTQNHTGRKRMENELSFLTSLLIFTDERLTQVINNGKYMTGIATPVAQKWTQFLKKLSTKSINLTDWSPEDLQTYINCLGFNDEIFGNAVKEWHTDHFTKDPSEYIDRVGGSSNPISLSTNLRFLDALNRLKYNATGPIVSILESRVVIESPILPLSAFRTHTFRSWLAYMKTPEPVIKMLEDKSFSHESLALLNEKSIADVFPHTNKREIEAIKWLVYALRRHPYSSHLCQSCLCDTSCYVMNECLHLVCCRHCGPKVRECPACGVPTHGGFLVFLI